ncbi:glutathione S-transferase family protein [Permianibacter sp. IMCC34836]|uniref:glutathione S-transferase family protein n=1 Tax=Permianibacter fluminis TaxID=2738515 RepID=UPI00155235B9|nr:glutathione S-transferase family protein [Permianibacter fluminis]NQD38496.1 glutathione S-transferase family protein [Permianibacter fluminis]
MYTLYEMALSGNCYKCRLALQQLGIPYERVAVDVSGGEQYRAPFRQMNLNSKVPVLKISETEALPESNAILFFLAERSRLMPQASLARAQVMQWLFFEQYSHEPYIATVRFWKKFTANPDAYRADIARCMPKGEKALAVMNEHLGQHIFFVDNQYSIADIALYAYTHVAEEGGYQLSRYPAVQAWLRRVEQTPGFVPITA